MIFKIQLFLMSVCMSIFFTLSHASLVNSADTLLSVPEKIQEHNQWCWAGSSQAILAYYGADINQCEIANWAWGRNDCCGNGTFYWTNTSCNWWNYIYGANNGHDVPGGSLQGILSHWGVSTIALPYALSQATSVSEINAGRPFVMRFGWTSGEGGHFLDGYGYDLNGQYLDYMDPWPGNGYTKSLYAWIVSAADHNWTHTLQVTTKPKPTVTSGAASSISTRGATLNGTVNANTSITTVTFDYGTTVSYGNTVTVDQSPVVGSTVTAVSKAITGLAPNTLYHFRINGANSEGTSFGSDMTFTTSSGFSITATKVGTGSGEVTSSPSGIFCGTTCSNVYDAGTQVMLTVSPYGDSIFTGWSGGCTGAGTCSVTMNSNYSVTATINMKPPVANFTATSTTGFAPSIVTFTDSSQYATSWLWNFGDGTTSTLQNPTHTYRNFGTYTASLTATNSAGSDVKTVTITVGSCGLPAQIGSTGYATIQDAYNAAVAGDTIQLLAIDFTEDLSQSIGNGKSITLDGGYLCGFGPNPDITILHGAPHISAGTVKLKNIRIAH